MKRIIFLLGILVAIQLESQAQIIQVPSDFPSIQQAIDTASNGDTILVANGTYLENIDFLGKAITVASEFIMDGDTSHISGTIIDGSSAPKPGDMLSTVIMQSGEDTTSIITGFTITGGSGTFFRLGFAYRGGGGIVILNSGGKVSNNIIEGNKLYGGIGDKVGFGIMAAVNNNHSAIIRDNIIRNNSTESGGVSMLGGGIYGIGGRLIIEGNTITGHIMDSDVRNIGGGGIAWEDLGLGEGVIEEVIIRNNLISGNQCYGPEGFSNEHTAFEWERFTNGGGILVGKGFEFKRVQIYNNIIRGNYAERNGGAIASIGRTQIKNNTLYNNAADSLGNSINLAFASSTILFNNLIWSDVGNGKHEIHIDENSENFLYASNNLIKADSASVDPTFFKESTYLKPVFLNDTALEPDHSSPAIGRGTDSVQVGSSWYHAPEHDYNGNLRPDPNDMYVDLGAIESGFPRSSQSSADLLFIGFRNRELTPSFHRNTLRYSMSISETFESSPELDLILEDPFANVEYRVAADLLDPESFEDSTATLTVTSTDGTESKTYEIAFTTLSADATLKELGLSEGQLETDFHPDSTQIRVILPCGSTLVPDVFPVLNHPEALMEIDTASNINSDKKDKRTTYVRITPEAGPAYSKTYAIEFFVDEITPPTISLLNSQIGENEDIGVISSHSGKIYLVPVDTRDKLLYLESAKLAVGNVMAGDTLYFSTMDLDTTAYWLFAVNECNRISQYAEITIDTSSVIVRDLKVSDPILYPIPIADRLFIRTDEAIKKVEIFNVHGILESSSEYREEGIYTGNLREGVHMIRVFTADGKYHTGKIIKSQNP